MNESEIAMEERSEDERLETLPSSQSKMMIVLELDGTLYLLNKQIGSNLL